MIILVSLTLTFIPDEVIVKYLNNNNRYTGMCIASLLGSITLMPGFIAFPLCGILLDKGVPYIVLSAFSTTLMMVGILTFPIEKSYFGLRVTLLRNIVSYLISLIIALMTGLFFGELSK
jgi:uncharacterized membrane protein YraQ (UPF0718 family)